MGDRDEYDEVLERFEMASSDGEEEEDEYVQRKMALDAIAGEENKDEELQIKERQQKLWFGMTRDQKHEFVIAFKVVSNNKSTIPASKVYNLMQAMGYTLLTSEINRMLKDCIKDLNGEYNASSLEIAVELWMSHILDMDDLKAMFIWLATMKDDEELDDNVPVMDKIEYTPEEVSKMTISAPTLAKYLDKILRTINVDDHLASPHRKIGADGKVEVHEEVKRVFEEICVEDNVGITYADFVNLFRVN